MTELPANVLEDVAQALVYAFAQPPRVLVEEILNTMVWPGAAFEVGRWALAHDLAEGVYGDMVTPVKAVLGGAYRELEHRLERAPRQPSRAVAFPRH